MPTTFFRPPTVYRMVMEAPLRTPALVFGFCVGFLLLLPAGMGLYPALSAGVLTSSHTAYTLPQNLQKPDSGLAPTPGEPLPVSFPAFASGGCTPIKEVPITISNSQSSPTSSPFQEMLTIDSRSYGAYINSAWSNVEFLYPSGTAIPAWIESGATNTSTATLVWLRLNAIPASSAISIGMVIFNTGCSLLSSTGPLGEAPQLSPTYAAYDDGSLVFSFYDNFAGTAISAGYKLISGATIQQNNGLSICCGIEGGLIWSTGYAPPFVFESDVTGISGPYPGLLLLSGTSGTSPGYALDDDAGGCSCSVGAGGIDSGVSGTSSPVLSLSTGIMGGAWLTSSSQLWYENYATYTGSATTYTIPGTEYVGFGLINASSASASLSLQWARIRAYPPNGVAPSTSFGSMVPALSAGAVSPSAPTIDAGQSLVLTANPSGGIPPYNGQWYTGGAPNCGSNVAIMGATAATLTVAPTANTSYCYTIRDGGGISGASPLDPVTVHPTLTSGQPIPAGGRIDRGQQITLSINTTGGTPPYFYQWYSGNSTNCSKDVAIPGARGATLTASPVTATDFCYSTGDASIGTPVANASSPAVLVQVSASLTPGTPSPVSWVLDIGQSVTLSASASGGTPPYFYQWYTSLLGSSPCTSGVPVAGAVSSTLNLTPSATTYNCFEVKDSASTPAANGSSWSQIVVNPRLQAKGPLPGPVSLDPGQSINLSVSVTGGTPGYAYQWFEDLTNTSNCTGGVQIAGATNATYAAKPPGTEYYCYEVTDHASVPVSNASNWTLVTVKPPLVAGSITPANPTLPPGQSVRLMASPSGGSPPYTISWYSGTQALCSGDNVIPGAHGLDLNVTPSSTTYYCYAVTDASAGVPASHILSPTDPVTVSSSPLVITGLKAIPATVRVGQSTTISVLTAGGTAPFTYRYAGLPSGCASSDSASIGCTPSTSGHFNVSITVSDSVGATASASTPLNVSPALAPLSAALISNRSQVNPGERFALIIEVQGGLPPYRFVWSLNGTNVTTAPDATVWNVSLLHPGNYTFRGFVTDAQADHTQTVPIHVLVLVPSSPPPATPSFLSKALPYIVLVVVLAVIAILAMTMLGRRRRQRNETFPPMPPESATASRTDTPGPAPNLDSGATPSSPALVTPSLPSTGPSPAPAPSVATLGSSYPQLRCVLCGGPMTSNLVCENCGYELVPQTPAKEATTSKPSEVTSAPPSTEAEPQPEPPTSPAPDPGRPPQPVGPSGATDSVEDITRELESWLKKTRKPGP